MYGYEVQCDDECVHYVNPTAHTFLERDNDLLYCVVLRCVALRCVALRCVVLCCVVLCCVVLC